MLHITLTQVTGLALIVSASVTIAYFLLYVIANLIASQKEQPTMIVSKNYGLVESEMLMSFEHIRSVINSSYTVDQLNYSAFLLDEFIQKYGINKMYEELEAEHFAQVCFSIGI